MIIGIDLGTTNTVVSYWNTKKQLPESIDLSHGFGKIPMPSVVQCRLDSGEEEWIVGEEAYQSMKIYPETTIRSVKRRMGTREKFALGSKTYIPEEISAKILEKILNHLKEQDPKFELSGCVVSVPYDFDDAAKKATVRACEIAGIKDKLICLIEEPIAAAIAYNMKQAVKENEKIMVFDFGGGTLDITVFEVISINKEVITIKVVSEGGEAYHGGDNIDSILMEEFLNMMDKKNPGSKKTLTKEQEVELFLRGKEAKERLSGAKNFRVPFTFCVPPFVETIDKSQFESLIGAFIVKTKELVLKTLKEAYSGEIKPEEINKIILEGGSSKMPWVKDMLLDIFGSEEKIYYSNAPALDISIGATYYAAMKMGVINAKEITSSIPMLQFNVTIPHDIGLEMDYGHKKAFYNLIPRGTAYPLAKKSQIFTLRGDSEEEMTSLDIKILERINKEDSLEDCRLIGELHVKGLPARPSGKTRLKLTINATEDDGIIQGEVEDLGYFTEYPPSGFKSTFQPERSTITVLESDK